MTLFTEKQECLGEVLESPPHNTAVVSKTDNERDVTVEYKCSEGYVLDSGHLKRTCGDDGQWSGQEPHCKGSGHM